MREGPRPVPTRLLLTFLVALLPMVLLIGRHASPARAQNFSGSWVITVQIANNGAGGSLLATAPGQPEWGNLQLLSFQPAGNWSACCVPPAVPSSLANGAAVTYTANAPTPFEGTAGSFVYQLQSPVSTSQLQAAGFNPLPDTFSYLTVEWSAPDNLSNESVSCSYSQTQNGTQYSLLQEGAGLSYNVELCQATWLDDSDCNVTVCFAIQTAGLAIGSSPNPPAAPIVHSGGGQSQGLNSAPGGGENFAPISVSGYLPGTVVNFSCTLPSGGASCLLADDGNPLTVQADANGFATLSSSSGVGIDTQGAIGQYSVTADANGYAPVGIVATVTGAGIISGDGQQQNYNSNGESWAPLVANGYAPGTGVTFHCEVFTNSSCSTPQGTTADSSGAATLDGMTTSGGAGTYTVNFNAPGYDTITFQETVSLPARQPGQSAVIVSGNNQQLPFSSGGETFAPLVAGGYTPGTLVYPTCSPPNNGGCTIDNVVTADADGLATLSGLNTITSGAAATYTVSFSAGGWNTLTFEESVAAPPRSHASIVSGNNQQVPFNSDGESFAPLVVAGYGPAPDLFVTFTCVPPVGGKCLFGGAPLPSGCEPGSSGGCSISGLTVMEASGTYTVRVTAPGYDDLFFSEVVLPAPLPTPLPIQPLHEPTPTPTQRPIAPIQTPTPTPTVGNVAPATPRP